MNKQSIEVNKRKDKLLDVVRLEMRKLDLRNYPTTQKVLIKGELSDIAGQYMVKDSILNIMFLPALELRGAELVKQNILAIKIEQSEDEVELEEAEYERIVRAANVYPGQSRADVELIDRILNKTLEIK